MTPEKIDKIAIAIMLVIDAAAIIVGMVAGMTKHTTVSTAASVSAIIISIGVSLYMFHLWRLKGKK